MAQPPQPLPEDLLPVTPLRFSTAESPSPRPDPTAVPVESPLTIDVQGWGAYTLMASPGQAQALAVGFLLTEGLIASPGQIALLQRCLDDASVIRVRLEGAPPGEAQGRNLIVASSCGLCGAQNVEAVLAGLPQVGRGLRVTPLTLKAVREKMEARQALHRATGGTHAAAIFQADGRIIALAEDIGRHNALDKAIGLAALRGLPLAGQGAALSGRVSLEMVIKASRVGLELLSAVSSPTSLALAAAERAGVTVCGFVRSERATAYTHPERIEGLA
jgi:FdhD protein